MKKLVKKMYTGLDSIEAYSCSCGCGSCSTSCSCTCTTGDRPASDVYSGLYADAARWVSYGNYYDTGSYVSSAYPY